MPELLQTYRFWSKRNSGNANKLVSTDEDRINLPVFMAPKIQLEDLKLADQEDI